MYFIIALHKMFSQSRSIDIFFLFLHRITCCGYSLDLSQQSDSSEYKLQKGSSRNKKKKVILSGYTSLPDLCFVMIQ